MGGNIGTEIRGRVFAIIRLILILIGWTKVAVKLAGEWPIFLKEMTDEAV